MTTCEQSRISLQKLSEFCCSAFLRVGMNSSDSAIASDALVTTDAMGVFTHGTKLLAGYLNKLKAGGYQPTARPCVEREGLGFALIDGQNALGQVGSVFAMQTAIKKARHVGIAYVALRHTGHIGAQDTTQPWPLAKA